MIGWNRNGIRIPIPPTKTATSTIRCEAFSLFHATSSFDKNVLIRVKVSPLYLGFATSTRSVARQRLYYGPTVVIYKLAGAKGRDRGSCGSLSRPYRFAALALCLLASSERRLPV